MLNISIILLRVGISLKLSYKFIISRYNKGNKNIRIEYILYTDIYKNYIH